VESVGAGLELHVDVHPGVAAVLRRVVAALYFELLQGVDRGVHGRERVPVVYGGDAVEIHLHPDVPGAVDGDEAARGPIHIADHDTRCEVGEVGKQPAVQRQVHNALGTHHCAERGVLRLEHGCRGLDFQGLHHIAHLKCEVNASLLAQLNHDPRIPFRAEAAGFHFNGILAGVQVADFVFSVTPPK
jgi:hypothetical protein